MAEKSKKVKIGKPAAVEVEEVKDTKTNYNGAKIIWGILFVFAGVVLLLANLGVIQVELGQIWRLWPALIIMAGLSVLALRGRWAVTVSIIATVAFLALATAVLTGAIKTGGDVQVEQFSIVQTHQAVERANVEIASGAGSVIVGSHDGREAVKGSLESDIFKLKQDISTSDGVQNIRLSLDGSSHWWRGSFSNVMTVNLNQNLPTSLLVDAGASNIRLDLSQVVAESVFVDSGASSIWVKMGDKQEVAQLDIDTGVSSVDLFVPKSVGVNIEIDAGLSAKDLPSDFVESGEDTWRSPNYSEADRKINIVVDMGVSSLKLRTY